MQANVQEKRVHQVFVVSVLAKGAHALIEIAGGLMLYLFSAEAVADWLTSGSTRGGWLGRHFPASEQHFYALYLLSHGVVKSALVVGLLREKLWAYPASIAVFGAFIAYQLYRYSLHPRFRAYPAQHLRPVRDLPRGPRISPPSQTPPDPLRRQQCSGSPSTGSDPRDLRGARRRARQFRRLSPRPPGGGRASRRARLPRAPAGDRRDLRSAPGAPLQARRAALPPDHARPARGPVRRTPAPTRCWCSNSTRALAAMDAEDFVADVLGQPDRRRRAWSPATTSPSARAAAAMSRCCASVGAAHGHRRRSGRRR